MITDFELIDRISVATDYSRTNESLVYFSYSRTDNHESYLCMDFITTWLKQHNVMFRINRFQVNECVISIPDAEIRTMLRLMFKNEHRVEPDW